jgi:hypothetical protein
MLDLAWLLAHRDRAIVGALNHYLEILLERLGIFCVAEPFGLRARRIASAILTAA